MRRTVCLHPLRAAFYASCRSLVLDWKMIHSVHAADSMARLVISSRNRRRVGHDMDFATKLDRIFALTRSMGGVQGVTGITINFGEDNKVQSFTVTFQLESEWPFFGQMTVRANGTAVKEYIHWRYSRKEKILDTSWVLEQYRTCVNSVKEVQLPVQRVRISAGGIKLYFVDGEAKELHNE